MRFKDLMKVGADGPKAASPADQRGLDRERRRGYTGAADRRVCETVGTDCKSF